MRRIAVLVTALLALSACAGTKPSTSTAVPTSPPPKGVVPVVFDAPGADPRPIRETMQTITGSPISLTMDIAQVSYPGVVCGFSFRGPQRPTSPVTIRMTGRMAGVAFDSGLVKVAWTGDTVSAGSASDDGGGWNFLGDATVNRNGAGWVVQLGAVPKGGDGKQKPSAATCTVTSAVPFAAANGPVGYWAGFATA